MDLILETITADNTLQNKTINTIQFSQSYPPTILVDSFEFYFEELIKGTVLEGAVLMYRKSEKHGFFIDFIDID